MIEICGKKYYIDIDSAFDIYAGLSLDENEVNTVITATYGDESMTHGDLSLISKEIVESKRNGIDTLYNLRFDTIKYLLDILLQTFYDVDGNMIVIKDLNQLTFAQKFAFNSLLEKGIIKHKI